MKLFYLITLPLISCGATDKKPAELRLSVHLTDINDRPDGTTLLTYATEALSFETQEFFKYKPVTVNNTFFHVSPAALAANIVPTDFTVTLPTTSNTNQTVIELQFRK